MIVMGIDPGPLTCGVAVYDTETSSVVWAEKEMAVDAVVESIIADPTDRTYAPRLVAIERPQVYGPTTRGKVTADLLRTAEVLGRLQQRAIDRGIPVLLIYRLTICRSLHVHGASKDSQIRARMIEMHGGSRAKAIGKIANRGPLYGVASHAWQALAVAVVAAGGD